LRRLLPPDVQALGRALVLAERDEVPGSVRTRFAEAGLAHLLAISGLHVGIVGAALTALLALAASPGFAAVAAAALVWIYVLSIGAPPSAVRAALLMAGWAAARGRGRPARTWDLLGAAAVVALVSDPVVLTEPGFQLSFGGFVGLGAGVAATGHVVRRLSRVEIAAFERVKRARRLRRRLGVAFVSAGAGVGAFLATAPIAAAHFQRIAPAAVLSHFAGAPLTGAAIGSLALTLVLPPPLNGLAASAAAAVLRWLVMVADTFARLPSGHLMASPPTPAIWVAVALAAVGVWRFIRRGRWLQGGLPIAASAALILAAPAISARWLGGRTLLCTLDVGQGDAAALRTPAGHWVLFDAGPRFGARDAGRDVVLPHLRRYGGDRVALFVLSHPDLDHLGGFDSLLDAIPVTRVLDTGDPLPKPVYARFLARASEEGIAWTPAGAGDRITLDGVKITILGPPASRGKAGRLANETSLIARITVGDAFVYLNTGDATTADELTLLEAWPGDSLRADLLKIGHHGSRTATDPAWLDAVRPELVVISAGRGNAYGHPHPRVLDRLRTAGVPRVWRTDRDGTLCIEVAADGHWRVEGERTWRQPSGVARVLTPQKGVE
jgi:competence protein ComEC